MAARSADHLNRARLDAGLSQPELWMRFFGLGGQSSALEVEAYLYGALEATVHDYNVLAHTLNERFAELGGDHVVAYRHN